MFFAIILRDDIDSVTDFFALLFTGYAPHFTLLIPGSASPFTRGGGSDAFTIHFPLINLPLLSW